MKKLKLANLYHSERIPVSGKLVERYNQCLEKLGFAKTDLKTFSIDGIGWSPEIAEEKENMLYLNNGEANPQAIIITPLQKGKPVYAPFHTFDRDMMRLVFKTYEVEINDITRDCALCLDFDQNIDAFYEPLDVLKYDTISINFHLINNLDEVQNDQLALIKKFKKGHNFIDEDLHEQLLDSARMYGDLRSRNLKLKPIDFKTNSFYTRAFGGVFVLRDFISPIVVLEDQKWYKEAIKDTTYDVLIYHISQLELMDKLRDHVIIEYDLEKVVQTERYERIKKYELSRYIKKPKHPIKDILEDPVLFKSYLNKVDIEARKKIMGVELYLEKMEISNQYKIADIIDEKLFESLHEPHSSLDPKHQDLIWKLLIKVAPKDVLYLYWYDKDAFYSNYKTWDDSFKDWVIDTISNNI